MSDCSVLKDETIFVGLYAVSRGLHAKVILSHLMLAWSNHTLTRMHHARARVHAVHQFVHGRLGRFHAARATRKRGRRGVSSRYTITPYTLHPAPCTLHPITYPDPTPYRTSCILHPTLHPTPYILHPAPCTLHPITYRDPTLYRTSCILRPTLRPAPCTLHPAPYNLPCVNLHPTVHPASYTLPLRPAPHALHFT
jgi:hypothetical protein